MYSEFITLLENRKDEIARLAAQEIMTSPKTPHYSALGLTTLLKAVVLPIEVFTRYLQNGDLGEVRAKMQQVSQARMSQQYPVEEMGAVREIVLAKMAELLERELPASITEQDRTNFQRRLESIQSIARVTNVSTRVNKPGPNSQS